MCSKKLTCYTHQMHSLLLSAVFTTQTTTAHRNWEFIFFFSAKIELNQAINVFFSVCTSCKWYLGTFHFSVGLHVLRFWRKFISSWSKRLGSCLANQYVISRLAVGRPSFWIVHKRHVICLKDHQQLVLIVICNYSALCVIAVDVSLMTLQGLVH